MKKLVIETKNTLVAFTTMVAASGSLYLLHVIIG